MPLHLKLRRGEKLLLNGAVIELGTRFGEVIIHNQSHCLRGSELLNEDEVTTPSRRVYFTVQMMIVDPENAARHAGRFHELLDELEAAFVNDEIRERLGRIREHVRAQDPYRALALLRAVLKYEDLVLARAKLEAARRLERDAHAKLERRV